MHLLICYSLGIRIWDKQTDIYLPRYEELLANHDVETVAT